MAELRIEIDDAEFLGKPSKERDLIVFKTLSCHGEHLRRIDAEGCQMAKQRDKKGRKRIVIGVGSISIAGVGTLVYELIKHFF